MAETADYTMGSKHYGGVIICGTAPAVPLTTLTDWECWNCHEKQVVRLFSGSGWYEDDAICAACGDNMSGYRPFRPRWRKVNLATAAEWLANAVPREEYSRLSMAAIKAEMGWDDPTEHEFRTFKDDDTCDMCQHGLGAHPMGAIKHEPPDARQGES